MDLMDRMFLDRMEGVGFDRYHDGFYAAEFPMRQLAKVTPLNPRIQAALSQFVYEPLDRHTESAMQQVLDELVDSYKRRIATLFWIHETTGKMVLIDSIVIRNEGNGVVRPRPYIKEKVRP